MQARPSYLFKPEVYDQSVPQLITARTVIENAIRGRAFAGNEVIMDVWCRTGKLAKLLAAKVPDGRVIGFDDSADMIAYAQQDCPANVSLSVRDLTGDVSDVKERADFLITSWVTPFVSADKQKQYIANLLKLLKPEGRLCVLFPMTGSALSAAIQTVAAQEPWQTCFRDTDIHRVTYTAAQYSALLIEAGLSHDNVSERRMRIMFRDHHELRNYITTSVSRYLPALMHDDTLQARFIDAVTNEYLSKIRGLANCVPYELTMLTATARRPALTSVLQHAGGSPVAGRKGDDVVAGVADDAVIASAAKQPSQGPGSRFN